MRALQAGAQPTRPFQRVSMIRFAPLRCGMSSCRVRPLAGLLALFALGRAAHAAEGDYETWTARVQGTYVTQYKPSFPAAYSGRNSLSADYEHSYTATMTAYMGFRPWRGGELYLDPEVTEGVPFSGLNGSAGFTNGELTRTAGKKPKLYRQRLFLRQTWGLGGGEEAVEADLNQMAGAVDKNRVVLTVGNFSTLDVFDDNAYAKDPRVHFMNAAFMAPLAYDYAADARGFGWGFALEWYQDVWALRIGRMTGPRDPNMLPLDFHLASHYGDQVEVEHAHTWSGQPGKVRVLAFRNRARIARFDDALAYLRANPAADPQTIFAVRDRDQVKYGVGVNLEQAINADVGVFLRAMRADGQTETLAFTETDTSVAGGVAVKGTTWGRGEDTVGVGLSRNMLSSARRAYLAAGGLSFFIGDGALNYRPEDLAEAYYSLRLAKGVFLTADMQRMSHPAYNADRGPANFYALRLHGEF